MKRGEIHHLSNVPVNQWTENFYMSSVNKKLLDLIFNKNTSAKNL
jgi:hypothetical protein